MTVFHCSFQSEVVSDVISCANVVQAGVDVPEKNFGDSRSNRSRDTRLPHIVTNEDNNDNDAS